MKGITAPVSAQGFTNALLFGTERFCQRKIQNSSKYTKSAISGAISGLVVSMVDTPFDLIKTQMQNQGVGRSRNDSDIKMIKMAKIIFRQKQFWSLYQGLSWTLIRNVPTYSLFFAVNHYLNDQFNSIGLGLSGSLLAGALTGIISWTVAFPFDCLKSRIQADNPLNRKYSTSLDVLRMTLKEEGHSALWRGLTPCLVRSVPVCAILFTVQAESNKFLKINYM